MKNCVYTYNGETYSELEIEELIEQNLSKLTFNMKDSSEINEILDPKFQMMLEDEYSWVNTIFKKFYPKELQSRIKFLYTVVNSDNYGEWTDSGITLYANAVKGTAYHEAWHEFSQMFLTRDEKLSLYKDAISNVEELKNLNVNNTNDLEIVEEYLAEEFMKYQLSNGTLILKNRPIRNIIFRRILSFLKGLFGNKNEPENFNIRVNELFQNLRNGELSNYTFSYDNIYFKSPLNKIIPEFENLEATKKDPAGAMVAILDHMDALISHAARTQKVSIITIFNNKKIRDNLYNYIRHQFKNEKKLSKLSDDNRELWNFIAEPKNFQLFIDAHIERGTWNISGLNKTVEKTILDDLTEDEIKEIEEVTSDGKQEWNLSGNEKDSKEVAANQVVFLIKSLTKKELIDDERVPVPNKYGLHQLVDFTKTWNNLQSEVVELIEYPRIYDKIVELSKSNIDLIDLVEQLPNPLNKDLSEDEQLLALRFKSDLMRKVNPIYIQSLKPTRNEDNEVVNLNIERVRASNTAIKSVKERFQTLWLQNSENNEYVYLNKDGEVFLDVNKIRNDFTQPNSPFAIKAAYDNIPEEEKQKIFENRISFLKNVGFMFSENTVNNPQFYDYIINTAFNKNGKGTFFQSQILTVFEFNREEDRILSNLKEKNIRSRKEEINNPLSFFSKKKELRSTNSFPKQKPFKTLTGNNNDIIDFLQYEIKYSGDYFNNSSHTAAGKIQYENSLFNTLFMNIVDLNDFEKYPTYQSLITNPELSQFDISKNPSIRGNIYLNSLFNLEEGSDEYGLRRRDKSNKSLSYKEMPYVTIKITNYNGLSVNDNASVDFAGETTVNLEDLDRLVMNVTTMLHDGTTEILRTADKSAAFALEISYPYINNVPRIRKAFFDYKSDIVNTTFENLSNSENIADSEFVKFNHLFINYLKGELERIYKAKRLLFEENFIISEKELKNIAKFSLFDELLNEETKLKLLNLINDLVAANTNFKFEEFEKYIEYEILDQEEDLGDKYLKKDIIDSIAIYLEKMKDDYLNTLISAGHTKGSLAQISVGVKGIADDVIVRSYVLNHFVYNIETAHMFLGDAAFFKAPFKRYSMYTSTGIMPETSDWFIDLMKKDKNFRLEAKSLGYKYRKMDKEVHSAIVDDVNVSLSDEYLQRYEQLLKDLNTPQEQISKVLNEFKISETSEGINEADGQGLISFDFYRILKKSIGFWYEQHEKGYEKLIQYAAKKKELEDLLNSNKPNTQLSKTQEDFEKRIIEIDGLSISEVEKEKLRKGAKTLLKIQLKKEKTNSLNTLDNLKALTGKSEKQIELERQIAKLKPSAKELSLFAPEKLGHGGPLKNEFFHLPAYYKFSVYPLLPGMSTDNSNIKNISDKMLKENIDILMFKSASKVTTLLDNGNSQTLYSDLNNRVVNEKELYKNITYLKYFKEQLQIEPKEELESTFGSQMRKLIFSNKYTNNVPTDFVFKGDKNKRRNAWEKLSEEQKLKTSELYSLHRKYIDLLHEAKEVELELLLEEIGVENYNKNKAIKINNYQKFIDIVLKEARKKETSDSIEYFLKLSNNGKLQYPIEASKDKEVIKQILLSIVNNRLVKPKINGQPLVQAAATGHEFKFSEKQYSDVLKPYDIDKNGNVIPMEVLVSFNKNYSPLLNLISPIDNEKIKNVDRLNEAMRNEEWYSKNIKLFTLVGYRIPSQAMNSIAYMKIKQFLAAETMDLIVLPSVITKIAGSDFDIDKMNIIRPFINNEGKIPTLNKKRRNIVKVKSDLKNISIQLKALKEGLNLSNKDYTSIYNDLLDIVNTDKINEFKKVYSNSINYLKQELQYNILEKEELTDYLDSLDADNLSSEDLKDLDKLDLIEEQIELLNNIISELTKINKDKNIELLSVDDVYNYYAKLIKKKEDLSEEIHQKKMIGNEIFNIFSSVLSRKDSFLNMLSPNSVELLENEANFIKDSLANTGKENYTNSNSKTSIYNPVYINEIYKAFLGSKKGLSIAAVAAPLNQTFQKVGAYVNDTYMFNGSKFKTNIYLDANKAIINDKEVFDLSDSYDSTNTVLKSEILSQYISAYVDAANNPFIFYMNGSLQVAPVLIYMSFLGVPIQQAVYLVNQDSIRDYIKKLSSLKSHIGKYEKEKLGKDYEKIHVLIETWNKYIPNVFPEEYKELSILKYIEKGGMKAFFFKVQELLEKIENTYDIDSIKESLSIDNLKNNIEGKYDEEQSKIINFYSYLQYISLENQSAALRDITSEFKFDTNLVSSVSSANYEISKIKNLMEQDDNILSKDIVSKIVKETEISPYFVQPVIVDMYSDISKMEMHHIVQNTLSALLNNKSTTQNKLKRERLIKDYFSDLTMYLLQNKGKYVGEEFKLSITKDWGLIKSDTNKNKDLKKNISTTFIELINKYNGENDDLNILEYSEIFKNLVITSSKYTDFKTLKWVGNALRKDSINSLSAEWRFFANLQNKDLSDIRNFFVDLAKVALMSYGENRSAKSFFSIVPNELHAEFILPYIKYFFEENAKREEFSSNFVKHFNDLFILNHPNYFKGKINKISDGKFVEYQIINDKVNYILKHEAIVEQKIDEEFDEDDYEQYIASVDENINDDKTKNIKILPEENLGNGEKILNCDN